MHETDKYFKLIRKTPSSDFHKTEKTVLMTFNDKYTDQAINSILSIEQYNDNVCYICLCQDLKNENISTLFQSTKANILIYEYKIDFPSDSSCWPNIIFLRIFAPWLIAENIEYALFLDCDILCTGTIDALFRNRYTVSMCNEFAANAYGTREEEINAGIYCNAGVLGLNFKKLKEDYTFQSLCDNFLKAAPGYPYHDQDFFNIFFRNVLHIWNGCLYNFQPYELKGSRFYKKCLNDCKLIHFAGAKPWTSNAPLYLIRLYEEKSFYKKLKRTTNSAMWKRMFSFPFIAAKVIYYKLKSKIQ